MSRPRSMRVPWLWKSLCSVMSASTNWNAPSLTSKWIRIGYGYGYGFNNFTHAIKGLVNGKEVWLTLPFQAQTFLHPSYPCFQEPNELVVANDGFEPVIEGCDDHQCYADLVLVALPKQGFVSKYSGDKAWKVTAEAPHCWS
jgi:hypothetical protein